MLALHKRRVAGREPDHSPCDPPSGGISGSGRASALLCGAGVRGTRLGSTGVSCARFCSTATGCLGFFGLLRLGRTWVGAARTRGASLSRARSGNWRRGHGQASSDGQQRSDIGKFTHRFILSNRNSGGGRCYANQLDAGAMPGQLRSALAMKPGMSFDQVA